MCHFKVKHSGAKGIWFSVGVVLHSALCWLCRLLLGGDGGWLRGGACCRFMSSLLFSEEPSAQPGRLNPFFTRFSSQQRHYKSLSLWGGGVLCAVVNTTTAIVFTGHRESDHHHVSSEPHIPVRCGVCCLRDVLACLLSRFWLERHLVAELQLY